MSQPVIRLFSKFQVIIAGHPVPDNAWHGRTPRSLLKVLALSPRGKTADELIDLFWPDRPVAAARQRVYEVVSRLRRTLQAHGADVTAGSTTRAFPLETVESGYRLSEGVAVDVRQFHADVAHVHRLYKEDPDAALRCIQRLERIDPADLLAEEPYADWALSARERALADARLLEQMRAQLLLDRGRDVEALEALEYLLQLDPLGERTARQAMETAGRVGERQRALHIFERLRCVLSEELGVEPSEATMRVYEKVARSGAAGDFARDFEADPSLADAEYAAVSADSVPVFFSSFVGRERELADITSLLQTTRLLSLRGMGGVGKTRLAAHVVHSIPGLRVHWVDLASIDNGDLIPHVLAAAVGVRPQAGTTILETVCDLLRPLELVLVLDNCEHVPEAVDRCIRAILSSCPGVRIVTTTRAAIGIEGETVYDVAALPVMDVDGVKSDTAPSGYVDGESDIRSAGDAVRLFLNRAAAVRRDFQWTALNATDIVHICRRLDGIPLAIELAASRLAVLTPAQVASGLDARFELLNNGSADVPSRHRSLHGLMEWSYDLAPDAVQRLWRRLSVFAGSFAYEAAEAVGASDKFLEELTALIDSSVLVREEVDGELRFRLPETAREYGLLQLKVCGEERSVRARHLAWCVELAADVSASYCGPDEMDWMERLGTVYNEVRSALDWSLANGALHAALTITGALWWFWIVQGQTEEGLAYAKHALGAAGKRRSVAYAAALHSAGVLKLYSGHIGPAKQYFVDSLHAVETETKRERPARQRLKSLVQLSLGFVQLAEADYVGAEATLRQSLFAARQHSYDLAIAPALWQLGNAAFRQGNVASATAYYEQAVALCRRVGYKRGEAACLGGLGQIVYAGGSEAFATGMLAEAVAICRELGDQFFAAALLDVMGWMARQGDDSTAAQRFHHEALSLRWTVRDRTGIWDSLAHLAETAIALGDRERAAKLFGARDVWQPAGGRVYRWQRLLRPLKA